MHTSRKLFHFSHLQAIYWRGWLLYSLIQVLNLSRMARECSTLKEASQDGVLSIFNKSEKEHYIKL